MISAPPIQAAAQEEHVRRVQQLYFQGLCLQAFEASKPLGPLHTWVDTDARLIGGRLAGNLGAMRLARWLHLRAWRSDRQHPEACYYAARAVFERRGPLTTWRFLRAQGELDDAPPPVRSNWLAFHACVLSRLRDFEAAELWQGRAELLCPDRPWIWVERASLFEVQDRYDEALAAARRSLECRPWFRPGVQAVAHYLGLKGQADEALALLTEADQRIENGPLVLQLATLQVELRLYADAARSYARFAELSPLLEKKLGEWLAARRSDTAYFMGDDGQALEYARQIKDPFYEKLTERLAQTPRPGRRVLLDVGFVRQHHQTCAPATFSALSRFWQVPVDHLELAQAICYDGTPAHKERRWAEQHGWVVHEFTITWESIAALIDRGIPFAITTAEPSNAHMQALIGYDSCRETMLVRDPFIPLMLEFEAAPFLKRFQATGPRGMVLVPHARANILDGIELPESALYEKLYRMQCLLDDHQRDQAAAIGKQFQDQAPDHRLTHFARRVLAVYDQDRTALLAAEDALLKLYPEEPLFMFSKFCCLRDLARRDERLALLESACAKLDSDSVFLWQHAQELIVDARVHDKALRLLRRSLRRNPVDVGTINILANLYKEQRRFDESLDLDRFAACLADKDEVMARNYFWSACVLKQADTALRFLDKRFRRFGPASSQSAQTLYWAYSQREQKEEAFGVLKEALQMRPKDGPLLLFGAEAHGNHGQYDKAAALLAAAEGNCQQTAWLNTAARLAELRGDPAAALDLCRQVVAAEPLSMAGQSALARMLAQTEGHAAVLQYLEQVCHRFPYHYGLRQLWIEWLREDGPRAVEPVVREMLAYHPDDPWTHRELACALSSQGRHDEALAILDETRRLEPLNPGFFAVLGQICERAGKVAEAREAYGQAIHLSVDTEIAIDRLMYLSAGLAGRREVLGMIERELTRQTIFGDGLLSFQNHAQQHLEPAELLAMLRRAHEARPDLWHAWSALIRQLVEMGQNDEAQELARQATARFPLLPRMWLDQAQVCKSRNDRDGAIAALQQALVINPSWGVALRELAGIYAKEGDFEKVQSLLEGGLVHDPRDVNNHAYLADILWRKGERSAALYRLHKAIRLDPGYEWAWRTLRYWARESGSPDLALNMARDLVARRGGEARSWLKLAENLTRPDQQEEKLAALDQALMQNPRCVDAFDWKAEVFVRQGRFDEALACCRPEVFGTEVPLVLRGRAAWLDAERGNLKNAVTQIKEVLAHDPHYYWGWSNLTEWCRKLQSVPDYLEAATMLTRLAPEDPVGFGFRGEAKLMSEDRMGGLQDFELALRLDPGYTFAGAVLFDEYLVDKKVKEAEQVLETIKPNLPAESILKREIVLAARNKDEAGALAKFRLLCLTPAAAARHFETALDAVHQAGWTDQAAQLLNEMIDQPDANVLVGRFWAEHVQNWAPRNFRQRLDQLLPCGAIGLQAVTAYVRVLGNLKDPARVLRCLRDFGDRIHTDGPAWGMFGYALAASGLWQQARNWLSDWHSRPDAEPWMLINLALAHRALGEDGEAGAVSRRAVTLRPDGSSSFHMTWLALDEALAGNTVEAAEQLARIPYKSLDTTHRYLHALIQALLELQQAAPTERGQLFPGTRRWLREAATACRPLTDDRLAVLRAYRRCLRRIALDCNTFTARMWSWWRNIEPLIPAESRA